ncbi:outer membrane porin protein [Neisseria meningitidis]|nr:outer membrane porin protein [Neisseria meningitidis]
MEGRNYQLQLTEAQAANGGASGQVKVTKVTKAKSRIRTKISDFGSFIGFKGSEDLGDGLKAVWQLEQDVSVAGGGATQWGNRESFIGLAGEFGTLRAGRVANQFDDASQAIDPWDSNNDVASQLGIFKRHDDMPVSVRYDSPEFSGFSGSVQFVPIQNSKSAYTPAYYTKDTNNNLTLVPAVVGKPGSDVYYAGLNYKNGGFAGNYAFKYARHANVGRNAFELFLIGSGSDQAKGTDPLKNHQVHRLTGGYEEGGLNLALAAQLDLSENGDKTKNSTTEIAATASYRFGNAVPRISYAHGFDFIERGKKGENTSYDQIIAGVDYDFSKRTSAIVSGAWLKRNTGIGNYTQINAASVGLRHKF